MGIDFTITRCNTEWTIIIQTTIRMISSLSSLHASKDATKLLLFVW